METFSQFAIVTPFNQRRPLCQVSPFVHYQIITQVLVYAGNEMNECLVYREIDRHSVGKLEFFNHNAAYAYLKHVT